MIITQKRPLLRLTTALEDIPAAWLRWIEPRIVREGTCWHWQGATDTNGEPVLTIQNPETGKRGTHRVKRIVADMFWMMKKHYDVIHECGNLTCINPTHFYISAVHHAQEDRGARVKARSTSISRYINRKPK